MLRYEKEIAWFSRLVRHPARKWSGSILTTPEPTRGRQNRNQSRKVVMDIISAYADSSHLCIGPAVSKASALA